MLLPSQLVAQPWGIKSARSATLACGMTFLEPSQNKTITNINHNALAVDAAHFMNKSRK